MKEKNLKRTTVSLDEKTIERLKELMKYTGFRTMTSYLTYLINNEFERWEVTTKFF